VIESARPAEPGDLDLLVGLATEADEALHAQRGGALWAVTSSWSARHDDPRAWFEQMLVDPEQCGIVGCIDAHPVGFAVVRLATLADDRVIGVIDELFVAAGAREVGVGELMMEAVLDWCRATGCDGIDGVAMPGDRATKNFFERFGLTARAILVHRDLGPRDGA
jgi:GNAT superfamily N-acetyltransferase